MKRSPTVDTKYITQQPFTAFQNNEILDIPFMLGTVRNESASFVYGAFHFGLRSDDLYALLSIMTSPENALKIFEFYDIPRDSNDVRNQTCLVATDALFRCALRFIFFSFFFF